MIAWPAVFNRFHSAACTSAGLVIQGKLQRQGEVIHVVAHRISDMQEFISELNPQSRDFHSKYLRVSQTSKGIPLEAQVRPW